MASTNANVIHVRDALDVDRELLRHAEDVIDDVHRGWHAFADVDWNEFWDDLEERADVDLGIPETSAKEVIKEHVREYMRHDE